MKNTQINSKISFRQGVIFFIALSLFFSVIYNWAYFWTLDYPLTEVPFSIADFVNSAALGAPFIILSFIIVSVVSVFMTQREEKNESESSQDIKTAKYSNSELLLTVLISAILFALFVFLQPRSFKAPALLGLLFLILWSFMVVWLMIRLRRKKIHIPAFIFYIPILTGWYVCFGSSQALADLFTSKLTYIYQESDKKIEGVLMRSLKQGILIKTPDTKDITFLPWSTIKVVEFERS